MSAFNKNLPNSASYCNLLFFVCISLYPSVSYGHGSTESKEIIVDDNGYVLFCLCMGRVGNQLEHLLGGMAFAKAINRTLVVPPFRTYVGSNRNVPFTEWFKFEPMKEYHRVILAEDFMETLAPRVWPKGKRFGFCYGTPGDSNKDCKMKEGNPFGPFWDGLGVDFDGNIFYGLSYSKYGIHEWNKIYPPSQYPVLAMKGAPAPYPMDPDNWSLQKYLVFSDEVQREADEYIDRNFPKKSFIGIHLRNGADWDNACRGVEGHKSYMASPQCLSGTDRTVTKVMCFPPKAEILRVMKNLVVSHRIKVIFVATDKYPMVEELKSHLSNKNVSIQMMMMMTTMETTLDRLASSPAILVRHARSQVEVYHADPWLPLVDWAVLVKSDVFVGNCVSSFTSFVKRARDVRGKPTYFWGLGS